MKFHINRRKPEITSGFRFLMSTFFILSMVLIAGCQPSPAVTETATQGLVPTNTEAATEEPVPTATSTPEPIEIYAPFPDQNFYFGVDLSYVNEMDDCGAVYLENGQSKDAYAIFSDHGANLVRVRLWNNPDWTNYSNYDDIVRTLTRARTAGMGTLLDFQYSDNWADPSKQAIPAAWQDLSEEELIQAVYDYTYQVLSDLNELDLMPNFVQVGNETNSGLLKDVMSLDWPRDAKLFNSGIKAVRDVSEKTGKKIKIILHVAQPENAGWWFSQATANGITDFDVIGLSYYPQWSAFPVSDLGPYINFLRSRFDKDVMIVETAYPWTLDGVDETASNILYQGVRGYPISIEGQRQFMIDLTQTLISNGGLGVVYWEPAWVSTQCSTRWGQGSHWENATFFDFKNNDELTSAIDFLNYDYLQPQIIVDGEIESQYGDPILTDSIGDNFGEYPHLDLVDLYARQEQEYLSIAVTIAGDIYADPWGTYMIYFDTTGDDQGATIDVDEKRPITVSEPYYPEFRLDIQAVDRKGTVSGTYVMNVWENQEWTTKTITYGIDIRNGMPSVIEIQVPLRDLGNPSFVNLAVITTGRGRVHTAGDILGTDISPTDWSDPVQLDQFVRFDLTN